MFVLVPALSKPEEGLGCLPPLFSILFLETGSLTESEVPQIGYVDSEVL